MLDNHKLFEANDELALIQAITLTDVSAKKMGLYAGLAETPEIKDFFASRQKMLKKINISLRQELTRIGEG